MINLFTLLLLVSVVLSLPGEFQAYRTYRTMRQAGKHYANGMYNAAERLYRSILADSATPTHEALTTQFNLAGTLVMQDKHEEARRLYRSVAANAREKKLQNLALYNEGTSLAREGIGTKKKKLLEQALRTYTTLLLRDSREIDARINYEIVFRQLQQENTSVSRQTQYSSHNNRPAENHPVHAAELLLQNAQFRENSLMRKIPHRHNRKELSGKTVRDW